MALRVADVVHDVGNAARPGSPEMPTLPSATGRLQLLGEVARGGMVVVLKGRDTDLGRELAVKVLLDRLGDDPAMVCRFIEEAQIAGQLQLRGVVPVYEPGCPPGQGPRPGALRIGPALRPPPGLFR
jgi:eukaryotic-like serine/threonine-protein kinase